MWVFFPSFPFGPFGVAVHLLLLLKPCCLLIRAFDLFDFRFSPFRFHFIGLLRLEEPLDWVLLNCKRLIVSLFQLWIVGIW